MLLMQEFCRCKILAITARAGYDILVNGRRLGCKAMPSGAFVSYCRGACRKLLDGLQIWLRLAHFYTSLTSESPKQNPSIRFCSTTVHGPAKPKCLRIHSTASTPWMERRAVLKLQKPPTRGMFFFSRKWSLSIPCCRCFVTSWTGLRASRPS